MDNGFDALMRKPDFRKALAVESLILDASEAIAKLMEDRNVSKAELARRMHKSRAWITQLMSGRNNMTIRTLAEVAYELDAVIHLEGRRICK